MKYLGIDFGEKKIGLAVSDEEGRLAFPYLVLLNGKKLLEEVEKIIRMEEIEKIVLGESRNFKGDPNAIMDKIQKFKKDLEEKIEVEVFFEPEFLTSAQAERIQGKTSLHDASAAAIILQSFLDKRKGIVI